MASLADVQIKHGTSTGYAAQRCRCDECRAWMRDYERRRAAGLIPKRVPKPPEQLRLPFHISATPEHGTYARFRRGCRCDHCTEARNMRQRKAYAALTDEQKTERRKRYANPERERLSKKKKYEANREQERAKRREAYAANPDYYKALARKRQARLKGVTVEFVSRSVVWERDGGVCHICGESADPNDWHLEHIVPLIAGGEHSYANTAVSHPRCNREKGASLDGLSR